jgi:hypothetical protein
MADATEINAGGSTIERFTLPASYAQQRMWFLEQLEGGNAAYNVPVVYRLRGPLDVTALEGALNAVVARHETLRTVFAVEDGVPAQVISSPAPVSLTASHPTIMCSR